MSHQNNNPFSAHSYETVGSHADMSGVLDSSRVDTESGQENIRLNIPRYGIPAHEGVAYPQAPQFQNQVPYFHQARMVPHPAAGLQIHPIDPNHRKVNNPDINDKRKLEFAAPPQVPYHAHPSFPAHPYLQAHQPPMAQFIQQHPVQDMKPVMPTERRPVAITCPCCQHQVNTNVSRQLMIIPFLLLLCAGMLGLVLALILYANDLIVNYVHKCPQCRAIVSKKKKLCSPPS